MKDWYTFFLIEAILLGLAVVAYFVPAFGYAVCFLIHIAGSTNPKANSGPFISCESYLGSIVFITFGALVLIGQWQLTRLRRKQWVRADRKR
jgi:hypothetical protein